eukprot:SAG22_NODE_14787_length_365_cov_0.586466_1_plen_83_part_01
MLESSLRVPPATPPTRTSTRSPARQAIASQSLGRDLSLSADYELLQAFVPEFDVLREPGTHTFHRVGGDRRQRAWRRCEPDRR